MLQSATNAFWSLTKDFPAWMDVRKRQEKSVSGKYLLSVVKERDTFKIILEDFKSRFFLTHYIGRENELVSKVYVAHVGDGLTSLTAPKFEIIDDADIFVENKTGYALYQNGYIILRENTSSGLVYYTVGAAKYSAKLIKTQIWNIIDEYALFLSLERYEDETNAQLMKRCLAVFKNPANSTKTGLENAIINSMMNNLPIKRDEIKIEIPDANNLFLEDKEFDTVFERLAQFNRDIFRTKKFDFDEWEYNFRKLEWLPHPWDSPIKNYQDGVGQLDDLKIFLPTLEETETTDIEIHGYKKSRIVLEEYLHKNMITRKMILNLKRYLNTLKRVTLDYKITATEVQKIDANHIKIESSSCIDGERTYYLADMIQDTSDLTILPRNIIDMNGTYKLKFFPKNLYEPIELTEAKFTTGDGTETNLIRENDRFKIIDGVLTDTYSFLHLTKLKQALTHTNLIDTPNGIRIQKGETSGSLTIDISKAGGKNLSYKVETNGLVDVTYNDNFVTYKGFTLNDKENILTASDPSLDQHIEIDFECVEISFEFLKATDPADQGSVFANIQIDGSKDIFDSGIWNTGKIFHRKFEKMTHVKIRIQKISSNPVSIAHIKAARYDLTFKTKYGSIVQTPFSTALPANKTGNILEVTLKAYDSLTPVLKYIHIGNDSEANTSYETKTFTVPDGGAFLDVTSNWQAVLYKIESGTEKLVDNNFVSKAKYRNDTEENLKISIDVSDFEVITDSSIPIEKTMYLGNLISYITVPQGKTLETISITGRTYFTKEIYSLSEILDKAVNENVYITVGANAFILRDENTLAERKLPITQEMFKKDADTFTFKNIPKNFTGCFAQESDGETATQTDRVTDGFVIAWIEPLESKEFIAYNQETLLTAEMSDVTIKDTWSPELNTTKLLYYSIQLSKNTDVPSAKVRFEKIKNSKKIYETWSLGKKNLRLTLGLNYSETKGYNVETFQVTDEYTVKSVIPLKDKYIVGGVYQELAKFIITPPKGMDINYRNEMNGESFFIEEDGFNKLKYSNVTEIISVSTDNYGTLPAEKYTLLPKEGIIYWNDSSLIGESATVNYYYDVPESISYKNIDSMYETVSFSADAYEALDEVITLKKLRDGETRTFQFQKKSPDKIVTKCTNNKFKPTLGKNTVKVNRINKSGGVLLKTGYYYDDADEYYYFNHLKIDPMCKKDNVILHNVYLIDDQYVFVKESSNYLLDSSMEGTRLDTLCHIDCAKHNEIEGMSKLGVFTSCDTYSCWDDFHMAVKLVPANNSYAIEFIPQQEKSYALINITRGVGKNIKLSFKAAGELKFKIMKEILIDGNNLPRTTYAEHFGTPDIDGKYFSFTFDKNVDLNARYYLMVQGAGTLDNLIMADKNIALNRLHMKKMNLLGFVPEEEEYEGYEENLLFDSSFNVMDNTEIDNLGKISTTSNVAYGLTRIFDLQNPKDATIKNFNVYEQNKIYYSEEKEGELVISEIYVPYVSSVNEIYVKVNDVIIDDFRDFTIQLDISEDSINYAAYREAKNANLLEAPFQGVYPYLQVHIKMPPDKIINNVEVYAMYHETTDNLYIDTYDQGEFTTKIYDTGTSGNYSFYKLDGEIAVHEKIIFWIRGMKEDENGYGVFTDWYQCDLDSDLKISNVAHIFKDYRLFQFKIKFNSEYSTVKIKRFILKRI